MKGIFKSAVNKIGVFKNKTADIKINFKDGAKISKKEEKEKSEIISKVKNEVYASTTLSNNSNLHKTAPSSSTLKILRQKLQERCR